MDVGRDPSAPYSRDLGNLRPEGTSLPFFIFLFLITFLFVSNSCFPFSLQMLNNSP